MILSFQHAPIKMPCPCGICRSHDSPLGLVYNDVYNWEMEAALEKLSNIKTIDSPDLYFSIIGQPLLTSLEDYAARNIPMEPIWIKFVDAILAYNVQPAPGNTYKKKVLERLRKFATPSVATAAT